MNARHPVSDDLVKHFQKFADDCNRDQNYAHDINAGALLSSLQDRWANEHPGQPIPYPHLSRMGKAVIIWNETDEMREGLRNVPLMFKPLQPVNVPSLLSALRAIGADALSLAQVEGLGKFQDLAKSMQGDFAAMRSEVATDLGEAIAVEARNPGSWLCLRFEGDNDALIAKAAYEQLICSLAVKSPSDAPKA